MHRFAGGHFGPLHDQPLATLGIRCQQSCIVHNYSTELPKHPNGVRYENDPGGVQNQPDRPEPAAPRGQLGQEQRGDQDFLTPVQSQELRQPVLGGPKLEGPPDKHDRENHGQRQRDDPFGVSDGNGPGSDADLCLNK